MSILSTFRNGVRGATTTIILGIVLSACRWPNRGPTPAPLPSLNWVAEFSRFSAGQSAWTMIDVTEGPQQADAHLLDFAGDGRVLIDTGNTGGAKLLPFLARRGIRKLKLVLITHPHHDHYGGLRPLIEAGVSIGSVIMTFPDRDDCDREKPTGCNWDELLELSAYLTKKGITVRPAIAGDTLFKSANDSLELLYAFERRTNPIGPGVPIGINDMSAICLLTHGLEGGHPDTRRVTRVLFTGDINRGVGTYLAKSGKRLEAELLKAPHHGTEGSAPNEFFDRVAAKAAFITSPHDLWRSERSKRIRDYFVAKKIPTYVSADDGDVTVIFKDDGYEINTHSPR